MKFTGIALAVMAFSLIFSGVALAQTREEVSVKGNFIYATNMKNFNQCVQMQKDKNDSDLSGMFDGGVCKVTNEDMVMVVVERLDDGMAKVKPKGSMSNPFFISVEAFK